MAKPQIEVVTKQDPIYGTTHYVMVNGTQFGNRYKLFGSAENGAKKISACYAAFDAEYATKKAAR